MNLDLLTYLFLLERERFAAQYPRVKKASLRIKAFRRRSVVRDFCIVDTPPLIVTFHPEVIDRLTTQRAVALIRHELAHLCEPSYSEREVDMLAEVIGGARIRYDHEDVQTTGRGRHPRPAYLPR